MPTSHLPELASDTVSTTVPVDSSTAATRISADALGHRWSLPTRIAFRFAFCYFGAYCLCNGNATVWDSIPVLGGRVQGALARIFLLPAQYLAQHLFHVPPPGNKLHPTGSGDTAIVWIAVLILLLASLLATIVWSALDRRRPHYQTLAAWLRFLIRLTLGFGMVAYGLAKVFPLQMPQPSMSALAEPFGMHSPMSILWSFIGLNPFYEMICGAAELLAGLLLLFRRTALAGALFTAFVVSNILLYNLFFDVPVKLYAGHLLILSLFVILPDAQPLFRFFWLHQPAAPTGVWVPPSNRRWFRRATVAIEIAFAVLALAGVAVNVAPAWYEQHTRLIDPCPLCGAWRIDTANLIPASGVPTPHSLPAVGGHPAIELDISSPTSAALRDTTGVLTYLHLKTDTAAHTLEIELPDQTKIIYSVTTPDPTHLALTPTGIHAHIVSALALTLLTPPGGYPLLTRGFHWVSEYPYQR